MEESGKADLAALLRVAEDDPPVLTPPRDLRYWHLRNTEPEFLNFGSPPNLDKTMSRLEQLCCRKNTQVN
jgi:hypothetical protein